MAIPIDGNGTDEASKDALDALRDEVVPATVGALPGVETGVTGATAQSEDFGDQMRSALPIVFGFVLVLAFLLMLYAFRSIVIALKAIVLNLLSVGAAYGILVLVFQNGWGLSLLGVDSTDGIDPIIPILLFVILFGLSMDYHVFILSRIRELHDRGLSNDEAIRRGITSTAGVVTAAAFVMVGVFAVFATLQFLFFKQFGVGLAAAVLIDATIIRGVLLPASMTLLGDAELVPAALAPLAAPASGRGPARGARDRPRGFLNLAAPPPDPATAPGPGARARLTACEPVPRCSWPWPGSRSADRPRRRGRRSSPATTGTSGTPPGPRPRCAADGPRAAGAPRPLGTAPPGHAGPATI